MIIDSIHFTTPESPRTPPRPPSSKPWLRETTNEQTQKSLEAPTPRKARRVVNKHETASGIRGEHDCKTINIDHVVEKVRARLFFSLSRFAETYAFNCITTRGKTHINGSSAPCEGRCHAAHAAFSCKLYDDIFEVVRNALLEKGFSQLDPAYRGYLTRRFDLSKRDIRYLNSENQEDRLVIIDQLASILTPREMRMTFSGTSVELQRGSTFENPAFSNHFDSSAEPDMRLLEDELDAECRLETKTPVEATLKLQEGYRKFVTNAIVNLNEDLNRLDNLQDAWNAMIACQKTLSHGITDDAFESYLEAVDNYLAAHKARFIKPKPSGTASLKDLKEYLKNTQSPAVLREIQASRNALYFELSNHHLQIPTDSEDQFTNAITEVEGRLTEAYTQLDALNHTEQDFKTMMKYGFGKMNEEGIVITPDKTALGEAFVDLIPKASKNNRKRDLTGDFIHTF